MNAINFTKIHDFAHIASKASLFPQVAFEYNKNRYTLTPCQNSYNGKVSYWISRQNCTVALYAFSVSYDKEALKMLEDEDALLSFVSMFEANEARASSGPKPCVKAAPFHFCSGDDMLVTVTNFDGFYNPDIETYVFAYNDCGSIAVYTDIDPEEATKLATEAKKANEYWGALLGVGGKIYDDPSYPDYDENQASNLEFCKRHFYEGHWFAESDWLNADYRPKEKAHE